MVIKQQIHIVLRDVIRNLHLTQELQVLQVIQERLQRQKKKTNRMLRRLQSQRLMEMSETLTHRNGAEGLQVVQREETQEDGHVVDEPGSGVQRGDRGVITLRRLRI